MVKAEGVVGFRPALLIEVFLSVLLELEIIAGEIERQRWFTAWLGCRGGGFGSGGGFGLSRGG